jgi:hypothetical protein
LCHIPLCSQPGGPRHGLIELPADDLQGCPGDRLVEPEQHVTGADLAPFPDMQRAHHTPSGMPHLAHAVLGHEGR